jgi:hypothetical protein
MSEYDWFGDCGFRSRSKSKDPLFSSFFGGWARKNLPFHLFLCVVVAWAGVLDCTPFAAGERCTHGRVRVSDGFSGKMRDRRFIVVKGVVWHSLCAMFCAPPTCLSERKACFSLVGVCLERENL